MATSKISVSEGSGKNLATYSISEDAATKEIQRIVPTDSTGAEWASPNDVHTTLTGLSSLNATQNFSIDGKQSAGVVITSIGSNIVTPYVSIDDGVTWVATTVQNIANNNTTATITTAGSYIIKLPAAISKIQLKVSTWVSGSVSGTFTTSVANTEFLSIGTFVNVLSPLTTAGGNSWVQGTTLATATTNTGNWEADISWQSITIGVSTNQPLTITVEQSNDGTTVHHSSSWVVAANSTSLNDTSRAFTLVSNFHRIKVTNSSGSTATYYLNTYGIPNLFTEPTALTPTGNKRVEVPEKATYRAAFTALTPVASILLSIQGSATKTIKVTKAGFDFACTTGAVAQAALSANKITAFTTPGTANTLTVVPLDSAGSAGSAVVKTYTTASSGDSGGGMIGSRMFPWVTGAAAVNTDLAVKPFIFDDGQRGAGAITLRGTSEWLTFKLSSIGTTPVAAGWIEWTEE